MRLLLLFHMWSGNFIYMLFLVFFYPLPNVPLSLEYGSSLLQRDLRKRAKQISIYIVPSDDTGTPASAESSVRGGIVTRHWLSLYIYHTVWQRAILWCRCGGLVRKGAHVRTRTKR